MSTDDQTTGDQSTDQSTGETTGDRHLDDTSAEQSITENAPTGGDETTEQELTADNAAEEDMLKTLDPGDAPA